MTTAGEALLLLRRPVVPPAPVFPAVPTRAQVCQVVMSFQGLTITFPGGAARTALAMGATRPPLARVKPPGAWGSRRPGPSLARARVQMAAAPALGGPLAWFEAALCCLPPAQRQVVYAAKHAAQDTHALILFASDGLPLYPEPNQPYQNFICPNFESDPASFVALVEEVILAGFIPAVFFQEDQPDSRRLMPIAIKALQGSQYRDLTQDVILVPGFDGVFPSWPPSAIASWGVTAKALGARYIGLEFAAGEIPLGGGPANYAPDGSMASFDVLLGEFDNWPTLGDKEFQILGRLLGSDYVRPPQQPSGDDPSPPHYLAGSSITFVVFEYGTYGWTRGWYTAQQMQEAKRWYHATGARLVC